MVSSFPVLGFMIDGGTMDFNLADGVVTLEVCHIVHCIPETELYIRKNGKMLFFFTVVGHGQLIDLAGASNRNEVCQLCGKIILKWNNRYRDDIHRNPDQSWLASSPDSRWYFLL